MTERPDAGLTPLRKALLSIEKLQGRVRALEGERAQAVAIIGVGCRLPGGGRDPESFFEALREGRDAIRARPPVERPGWPAGDDLPPAGYLDDDLRAFDAGFFGISPREATSIDPQHRLLLECAWEALEHAGIDPRSLAGTRAGVFLGMAGNDYANMQMRSERMHELLHSHFASGTGHSMASGRLSYLLGLHGPSMTVDTACSSSLVAVHLACQSLRTGESELAFAAGVNLILSTDYTTAFHQARMLSSDGRCKTFDAAADGFSRAEGCGVLVLRRLADAQRDGDRILAVIRGSAVNQDGPSSGLTAPNGPAQEAVIRAALAQAQLRPADIGYVEAHGTGTSLGDPIEVQALGAVFGDDGPRDQPLLIGSVKTNLGHLEAAAGVAGLIKVIEALRHRTIPASLHFSTPNPHIPWDELPLSVATTNVSFPELGGARRAGVSSFGFSGTNAHVIVEEAPAAEPAQAAPERVRVLTLSAADDAALRESARRMRAHLGTTHDDFADVCATASAGRAHLEHRLAICATDADAAAQSLDGWLNGDESARFVRAGQVPAGDVPALAFLFTGQGAQYAGMAWSLREHSPVVRRVLDECDALLRGELEAPLLSVLDPAGAHAALIDRTDFTQPALFAVQVALAELWRSWGVRPSLVLGHSIGEYAAAYLAGVFTLEDALRVVAARGRLMHDAGEAGRMIAVLTEESRVREWVDAAGMASIAAINAPSQIVVSGAVDAVAAVEAAAHAAGVQTKSLRTSQAFHSPLMDGVVPELEAVLRSVTLRPADRVRFISTVTGAAVAPDALTDPRYWSTQVRLPVRYADAVAAAAAAVPRALEIGPHPTLAGLAALGGVTMPVHASLQRDQDDWGTLMTSAAALHVSGVPVAWAAVQPSARRVDLPRYPFQRETLWVDMGSGSAGPRRRGGHPLLGARVPQPGTDIVFDSVLDADTPPFIREHRVLGRALLPGTAFLEIGLAAGRQALGGAVELHDVELLEPMQFDDSARRVHTRVDPRTGTFTVHSAVAADDATEWTLHCTGRVVRAGAAVPPIDLAAARARCPDSIDGATFAAGMAARGYDFGPRLRGVERISAGRGLAVSTVSLPEACADDVGGYGAHPLLLDAAVQTVGAAMLEQDAGRTWVPLSIARVALGAPLTTSATVVASVEPAESRTLRAGVTLTDGAGTVLAALEGMTFRELTRAQLARDPFLETIWVQSGEPRGSVHEAHAATAVAATRSLAQLAREEDAAAYERFVDTLEARSAEFTVRAFRELGWTPAVGDVPDAGTLVRELGIIDSRVRLFERMLEILAEQGILEGGRDAWRVARPLPDIERGFTDLPLPARVADAAGHPPAESLLLERCGRELANLLRGIGDPLELLFPAGGADDAAKMYYDAPFARIFNRTLADIVAAAAAAAADGRALRVLEVGGGTAGTTRRILDRLDAEGLRVEYTFTDVSPLFLERGRSRWADRTDIEYRTFDLDRDIEDQGLAAGSFDVVVAANCLHAARDLRAALGRVRALLRSGGMLAAVEVFAPHRWFDLTVGLTDGWWHFTDAPLRPAYPCIDAGAWSALLADVGFADAHALPLADTGAATGFASRSQGVVLAWRGAAPAHGAAWLVAGTGALADAAAAGLAARGASVQRATTDFRASLRARTAWDGVVLCEPAAAGRSLDSARVRAAVRSGMEPIMTVAADVGAGTVAVDRLCIVTRGAQVAVQSDVDVDPSAATVWGAARTLELELPELAVHRLDLDATPARDDGDVVVDWLLDAPAEPELAARFGALHARRLVPATAHDTGLPAEYRLTPPAGRSLDDLAFEPGERRAPGAGAVEVRVVASGVNFKDVLSVLGMYPGDAGPLGSECAGVVTAVGAGVTLEPGTHVMVAAGHGYGRHVIADARMVARKPDSLTFAQAAALPIAYLTAYFALEHLAALRAGERVLIHAAAGGVGMAAVALAQSVGAEVYATAGSDEKRALLRAMGVRHVFDSRSASFARDILAATQGDGVHVVLNSLADDLVDRTFDVIARGGRFLEIGKRGIWTQEQVDALGRDIQYHIIDWGETSRRDPDLVGRLHHEVMERVASGELPPLPTTTFPLARAADAFRFMAQGRHIGKIVLVHPLLGELEPVSFDADGAYLITGGTAGLGLSTAAWAVEQGARELVLVSRRGAGDNAERIDTLRQGGARVHVVAADVGTADGVARVMEAIAAAGITRIGGVIHSAGALSDRTLQHATWDDFDRVLRAKVYGTTLLDAALVGYQPGFFVCYSSIASVLGAPGQANHAAANAFQDAFAATRAVRGQTGMSIGWGPWSETGAAARADVLDRTRDRGLTALTTQEGLAWLERACARPATHLVGTRIDDPAALDRGNSPLFASLRPAARAAEKATTQAAGAPAAARFLDELAAAPVDARRGVLLNRIRMRIRRVLGLAQSATLDADRPLGEIGLDSLLAVELRNVLAEDVGQRLPATLLFDHATPTALANHLYSLIAPAEPEAAPEPVNDSPVGLVGVLESLDDDDVDRLLAEKLKQS